METSARRDEKYMPSRESSDTSRKGDLGSFIRFGLPLLQ